MGKTGFDSYLEERLADPEFREGYIKETKRIAYRAGLELAIELAEKMHRELLPLEQSSMPLFQDACNKGAKSALTEIAKRLSDELAKLDDGE